MSLVVYGISAEEALPELWICSFSLNAWFDRKPEKVQLGAQISVKVFATSLAADTRSILVTPEALVAFLILKHFKHRVNVDPLFAG